MINALSATVIATAGNELFGAARTLELVSNPHPAAGKDRKDRAHLFNAARNLHHRTAERQRRETDPRQDFLAAVNSLSNYERKRWMRVGKPGDLNANAAEVLAFKGIRERGE